MHAFPAGAKETTEQRTRTHRCYKQNNTHLSDHKETTDEGYTTDDQQKKFTSMTSEEEGWIHVRYACDQAFQTHKLWVKKDRTEWNGTGTEWAKAPH